MAESISLPEPANAATTMEQLQLMIAAFDAISKGIEAQREHIFDTHAVATILRDAFPNDKDDHIFRTCQLIRARLDETCTALEELTLNIEQHVSKSCDHEGEHVNTGVTHG